MNEWMNAKLKKYLKLKIRYKYFVNKIFDDDDEEKDDNNKQNDEWKKKLK